MTGSNVYYLVCFPEIQNYQNYKGYEENSHLCLDIDGAAFINKEWADAVDNGDMPLCYEDE